MLHAHYVITIHLNQLAVMEDTRYARMNRKKLQILVDKHFLMLLELHINLSPLYHQTDCCAICCTLPLIQALSPVEKHNPWLKRSHRLRSHVYCIRLVCGASSLMRGSSAPRGFENSLGCEQQAETSSEYTAV